MNRRRNHFRHRAAPGAFSIPGGRAGPVAAKPAPPVAPLPAFLGGTGARPTLHAIFDPKTKQVVAWRIA